MAINQGQERDKIIDTNMTVTVQIEKITEEDSEAVMELLKNTFFKVS